MKSAVFQWRKAISEATERDFKFKFKRFEDRKLILKNENENDFDPAAIDKGYHGPSTLQVNWISGGIVSLQRNDLKKTSIREHTTTLATSHVYHSNIHVMT